MSDRKYTIGTGYHCRPGQTFEKFYQTWWDNTHKYANPAKVLVIASGGNAPKGFPGSWLKLQGDLGHVHDLNNHRKPYHFCGWSMAFITTALVAYMNETDFIWKEQDVLAFGPWPEKMYAEIGEAGMIFGSARIMPAVQSLVLCKHWFIPEFVRLFLGSGSEQDKENEGEQKFVRLEKQNPKLFARYSFGYDRDRPFNMKDPVWYAQHLSGKELTMLVKAGLLPPGTDCSDNTWAP